MSQTPDRPPWTALYAFLAAARAGSFRDAASALGVTPSAVSHQVRALEDYVGHALFDRGVRHVRLTARGEGLAAALDGGFGQIEAGLAHVRMPVEAGLIRIATLPLFASVWLSPRLSSFEAAHPALSLSIETGPRLVDLLAGEADVAIRSVALPTPGLSNRKLLDLRATPLCAPALAATLREPADLAGHTLISLSVGRAGWPAWLAAFGCEEIAPKRTLYFDTLPAAIEAAALGKGVLLGLLPLIWDSPAARDLVAPFAAPPQSAGAFFVATRREDSSNPTVRAFVDWLLATMHADMGRLQRLEKERLRAGRQTVRVAGAEA
jgi:LysR family transcriptional regulator, glycine cleavage system transcriptional activator